MIMHRNVHVIVAWQVPLHTAMMIIFATYSQLLSPSLMWMEATVLSGCTQLIFCSIFWQQTVARDQAYAQVSCTAC